MTVFTLSKEIDTIDAFEIKGEKFVVLKKDYLDELLILMRSFLVGEELLKKGRTRSFDDFWKSISKKQK